jgi:hypothetical protein
MTGKKSYRRRWMEKWPAGVDGRDRARERRSVIQGEKGRDVAGLSFFLFFLI